MSNFQKRLLNLFFLLQKYRYQNVVGSKPHPLKDPSTQVSLNTTSTGTRLY